jgi:hypothetical protein
MSFSTTNTSEIAQILHEQIVSGQDTSIAYVDNMDEVYEVIEDLIAIDDESTPYDADMAVNKGTALELLKYNKSGKFELVQINPINIVESEKLLDKMETEIKTSLNEDSTQKETLSQIIRYIAKTYKYDMA